jgi:uncharacterized membrane protein YeiH
MDTDIASVFYEVGLPLWKVATTFAIGTPPEQLVIALFAAAPCTLTASNQMSPRQFCAMMDAVGIPVWSVHRALDRVFQGKRRWLF